MPVFKGTEASLLRSCVFEFVGVVKWTERFQNKAIKVPEVKKWRTPLRPDPKNQVPTLIFTEHVTFKLVLFDSGKSITVLHHSYMKNCCRLFRVGAALVDIENRHCAVKSVIAVNAGRWPSNLFFPRWNFFADPNFFLPLKFRWGRVTVNKFFFLGLTILFFTSHLRTEARLAQSVEHGTLNPRVVCSSPTLGAFFFDFNGYFIKTLSLSFFFEIKNS